MWLHYSALPVSLITVFITGLCVQKATSTLVPNSNPVINLHSSSSSVELAAIPASTSTLPFDAQRWQYVESVKKTLLRAISKLDEKDAIYRISRQMKAPQKRQEDGDDGDEGLLPDFVPEILNIVGSALAGNVSTVIDNTINLLPAGVSNQISSALGVLVDSINSNRPATTTPTTLSTSTTTTPIPPSTPEDEDYNEVDLRTNVTTPTNVTPANSSIDNLDPSLATPIPSPTSSPSPISLAPPTIRNSSDTTTTTSAAPQLSELSLEGVDTDNKANWLSLVNGPPSSDVSTNNDNNNQNNGQLPVDDIDADNKANWISLLTNTDNNVPVNPSTFSPSTVRPINPNLGTVAVKAQSILYPLQSQGKPSSGVAQYEGYRPVVAMGSGTRDNSKAPGSFVLDAFSSFNRYPGIGGTNVQLTPAFHQISHQSTNNNSSSSSGSSGGSSGGNSSGGSLSSKLTALLQQSRPQLSNYSSNVINLIKYQEWISNRFSTTTLPRDVPLMQSSSKPKVTSGQGLSANYAAAFHYGTLTPPPLPLLTPTTPTTSNPSTNAEDEDEDEYDDNN